MTVNKTQDELMLLAQAGDVAAQADIGYRLDRSGDPELKKQAISWYTRAAEAGNLSAKYNLAQALLDEDGVKGDPGAALALFEEVWRSRQRNDERRASAALNAGWICQYRPEVGCERQAVIWYKRAARYGDSSAFYNLGLWYARKHRYEYAQHWLRLGAAAGHRKSKKKLAEIPAQRRSSVHLSRFSGLWAIRDSPTFFLIENGTALRIQAGDQEEMFDVSDVRYEDGILSFSTLCRSTDWRVRNGLLLIDSRTLLLTRDGASKKRTVAWKSPSAPPWL